ncbi:MAG: tetratricopeptide repeat-containing sensor histidine kinase [Candidatus Cloacimonetes bacterium]|nr:tetratricopeptide repeat-containing sensor histidine kinase [Candidatus Cloacimonadota bacterium]
MNIKKNVFFLLLLFFYSIFAKDIKELEMQWQNLEPNEKLTALHDITEFYFKINPQKSLEFAQKTQKEAELQNNKAIEATALRTLGILSIKFSGDYEKALNYFLGSLTIVEELKSKKNLSNSLTNVGIAYEMLGDYQNALKYHQNALIAAESNDDKNSMSISYNNIGNVYNRKSDYNEALTNYFKSMQLKEDLGDLNGVAVCLNNIGIIYEELDDIDNALEIHKRSLGLKRKQRDNKGIASSLNNIANLYTNQGKIKESLEYHLEALEIKKKIGDKRSISNSLRNIGTTYHKIHDDETALNYYQKSLDLDCEINNKTGLATSYLNMSNVYLVQKKYDKVLSNLNNSEEIALVLDEKNLLKQIYETYYKLYTEQNNSTKALEYHKKISKMKDEIFNEKKSEQIIEMTTKYDTKQKEKEIVKLEESKKKLAKDKAKKEKQLIVAKKETEEKIKVIERLETQKKIDRLEITNTQLELNNKQMKLNKVLSQRLFFIVIFAMSILLAFVFYNQYRNKKRDLKNISEANEKIRSQNVELEKMDDSQKKMIVELQDLNATKNKFFSIIAHDLKNGFSSLLSGTNLLTTHIKKLEREAIIEIAFELKNSADNLNNLLQNLLQWSRVQTNRIKNEPEKIPIYMLLAHNVRLLRTVASQKDITLETDIDEYLYIFADKNMINSVVQNLIYNAIKFTNNNGKIIVKGVQKRNTVEISISDNGVGMDKSTMDKLFRLEEHVTTHGTADEQGTGLGLLLCKEFVNKNDGEIFLESKLGKGTKVSFVVPLAEAPDKA